MKKKLTLLSMVLLASFASALRGDNTDRQPLEKAIMSYHMNGKNSRVPNYEKIFQLMIKGQDPYAKNILWEDKKISAFDLAVIALEPTVLNLMADYVMPSINDLNEALEIAVDQLNRYERSNQLPLAKEATEVKDVLVKIKAELTPSTAKIIATQN